MYDFVSYVNLIYHYFELLPALLNEKLYLYMKLLYLMLKEFMFVYHFAHLKQFSIVFNLLLCV